LSSLWHERRPLNILVQTLRRIARYIIFISKHTRDRKVAPYLGNTMKVHRRNNWKNISFEVLIILLTSIVGVSFLYWAFLMDSFQMFLNK
jgi:hypothetical protein